MSSPFHHRRSQSEVHFRIPADFHLQLDPFDSPSPEDAGDGTANASSNKTGRTGHRRSSSVDGSSSSLTEGIEDRVSSLNCGPLIPNEPRGFWPIDNLLRTQKKERLIMC